MDLADKIEKINSILLNEKWFDFEVYGLNGGSLIIVGSTDFSYGHSLEIIFKEVFYLNINLEWKSDISKPVLVMVVGDEAVFVNKKYQIEQGNILFKFILEGFDGKTAFYIAAHELDFNTDTVYYFKKENLEVNERIADWVR